MKTQMTVTPPLDLCGDDLGSLTEGTSVRRIDWVDRGPNGFPTARFVGPRDQIALVLDRYTGEDAEETTWLLSECDEIEVELPKD